MTVVLEALESGGAIKFYRLLNSANYPDFYVLDSKEREWLLECKNLALKRFKPGDPWIQNSYWVRNNILNKEWTLKRYMLNNNVKTRVKKYPSRYGTRSKKEYYSDDSITIRENRATPVLIISHLYFDTNAYQLLKEFFGENIVLTGDQIIAPSPWTHHVFGQLKHLFTQ